MGTRKEARKAIHHAYTPCIVELNPGNAEPIFDAFPLGHPIPRGARIVERWTPTANGKGRWKEVESEDEYFDRAD